MTPLEDVPRLVLAAGTPLAPAEVAVVEPSAAWWRPWPAWRRGGA